MSNVKPIRPPPSPGHPSTKSRGRLPRPRWLNPELRDVWKEVVSACDHAEIDLGPADIPLVFQTACLYQELRDDPINFSASRHSQLRLLWKALGVVGDAPEDAQA